MLSFRGFSEITGLHLFLKKVFTKPFALKVMLSVLSLFILHDFLLSSVMWWSSFALILFVNTIIFNIYVVVNFLSQIIFVFLLFLGMVMYANEIETKEK